MALDVIAFNLYECLDGVREEITHRFDGDRPIQIVTIYPKLQANLYESQSFAEMIFYGYFKDAFSQQDSLLYQSVDYLINDLSISETCDFIIKTLNQQFDVLYLTDLFVKFYTDKISMKKLGTNFSKPTQDLHAMIPYSKSGLVFNSFISSVYYVLEYDDMANFKNELNAYCDVRGFPLSEYKMFNVLICSTSGCVLPNEKRISNNLWYNNNLVCCVKEKFSMITDDLYKFKNSFHKKHIRNLPRYFNTLKYDNVYKDDISGIYLLIGNWVLKTSISVIQNESLISIIEKYTNIDTSGWCNELGGIILKS